MRLWLIFILSFLCFTDFTHAQGRNDLMVTTRDDAWHIAHTVQKGETVFMLARRYHVPPAILADANGVSYQDQLKEHSTIYIPLGAYNLLSEKPANMNDARTLYYKVSGSDNLYRISRHLSVPQRILARWNNLPDNDVRPGETLLVGWLLYDATQLSAPVAHPPVIVSSPVVRERPKPVDTPKYVLAPIADTTVIVNDSLVRPLPSSLEALFIEQTQQGQNLLVEKGTAAFYAITSPAAGAADYAFHNTAARGAVIRVKNINNGRVVFVKVLGPLSSTKQYAGCIIGLSNTAKALLGVRDTKAFCELSYGGY